MELRVVTDIVDRASIQHILFALNEGRTKSDNNGYYKLPMLFDCTVAVDALRHCNPLRTLQICTLERAAH